tara:strand:- start:2964 stop:4256 length:1293 start_codon:yes stop_codon:yes gene_type:complete
MTALLERTALDIVKGAFSILRVRDRELPLPGTDREAGFDAINDLVKHWQTQGFNLWTETRAVLPLVASQAKYNLGTGGDKCFNEDDFYTKSITSASSYSISLTDVVGITAAPNIIGYDATTSISGWTATDCTLSVSSGLVLTNTAANGYATFDLTTVVGQEYIIKASATLGTSLEVVFQALDTGGTLDTDMIYKSGNGELRFTARQTTTMFKIVNSSFNTATATLTAVNYINTETGDHLGIILDDGDIQWSRVNYISGLVVTSKDSILSAATAGNSVYTSPSIIDRPLSLVSAQYAFSPTSTIVPSEKWTRKEYFNQPDKTSQGIVSQWYYSPQLTTGDLYVWQIPRSNKELLLFSYIRPVNVTEENSSSPDFPSEWFLTLKYCVADLLTAEYSVPDQRIAAINMKAIQFLQESLGFDNEDSYIQFQVGK